MSIINSIVLSLALGIDTLIVVRSCVKQTPIRLSKGLFVSLLIALVHVVCATIGIFLGNLICFEYPETNRMVFLGLLIVVAVKLFMSGLRKERALPAYDIRQFGTVIALALATGINVFIIGLSVGFIDDLPAVIAKLSIPLFLIIFLFSMWAIMLGRQKVQIKERRWTLFAALFVLIVALAVAFA